MASDTATDNRTVLVVDDNATNVRLLDRQLQKQGYRVLTARDGLEALEQVAKGDPDVILLDLMMPKMNGYEVCERLKSDDRTSRIQIIILSAKSELKDKVAGLDVGADDYVTKPYQFEEVHARVRAALRIKRLQDELLRANKILKATQAQLVQAEKLAAIGELSAGIAHEINNPIAIVYGHTQLALRRLDREKLDGDFRGRYQTFLQTIEQESRRCKVIIENLLRFSRQEKVVSSHLDINEIVEATLTFFALQLRLQSVEVTTELAEDLPAVAGNFTQLEQVFVNIVLNAKQVMPSGGRLTVRTWRDGNEVAIGVSDTGKGIPRENLRRIFDPFFTTKEEWQGTGLGLSVSYKIVKDHGGRIDVQSELDKGSTFEVRFPVAS